MLQGCNLIYFFQVFNVKINVMAKKGTGLKEPQKDLKTRKLEKKLKKEESAVKKRKNMR